MSLGDVLKRVDMRELSILLLDLKRCARKELARGTETPHQALLQARKPERTH